MPELTAPYWTGGPPYPSFPADQGKHGLSILDWFAGHALCGLMGSALIDKAFFDQFTFPVIAELPSPTELPSVTKLSSSQTLSETPSQNLEPPPKAPPTTEQLALIAYAMAGQMTELRKQMPIEPKPVPAPPAEENLSPIVLPPDDLP